MLKKITAVCLSLILAATLAVPALAASEPLNAELTRVTSTVKTLLEIDDSYTEFEANPMDGEGYRVWDLSWRKEDGSIDVTYCESIGVLSYYRYDDKSIKHDHDFSPSFPAFSLENAKESASTFLKKLLRANETPEFSKGESVRGTLSSSNYYLYGTVLLNGLNSPVSFSIRVDSATNTVSGFSRQDSGDYANVTVPPATPSVSVEKAVKLLSDKVKLELQYVLTDDDKHAVLRYVPVYQGDFIVDAKSGEVIDLDKLYSDYRNSYTSASPAAAENSKQDAGGYGALTEKELATIAGLEGVLSKEKLDPSVRAIKALGIDSGYKLYSARYWKDSEDGVLCRLTYTKANSKATEMPAGDAKSSVYIPSNSYKYITVDAKDASLKSVSSNLCPHGDAAVLSKSVLEDKADAFIKATFGKLHPNLISTPVYGTGNNFFAYCDSVNGIPFPASSVNLTLDEHDGTVSSLYFYWKDNVEFAPVEINADVNAALAAYNSCYEPELMYVSIPSKDKEGYMELMLAYMLRCDDILLGIDAKSGEPVYLDNTPPNTFAYNDLEGAYGKAQIELLAEYGIGLSGESFLPWNQVTQKDALLLLLSADGFFLDGEEDEQIYEYAYSRDFLIKEEKAPEKLLSRIDFIKLLVSATKYSPAAELRGVFAPGYTDDGAIPAELRGYAAIAKALGIAKGDTEGQLDPFGALSRQDAALMLYNYLARQPAAN